MRYLYRTVSGHVVEVDKRISDPHPEVCPHCGDQIERRVWTSNPVIWKGSGFYSTDKALDREEEP